MQATNQVQNALPAIPLTNWESSKDTLHLFLQIAGKIRLKLMPRKNHWWHVTLYVTPTGLSTAAMPYQDLTFSLDFDFIGHRLEIKTCKGDVRTIPLYNGLTVATFYQQVFASLQELGINVKILAKPYDNKTKTPFAQNEENHTYEPEKVEQFYRALAWADMVMKKFSGRFYGKTCPVQFYWHHFDLTVTRFSGKQVPVKPEASIVEKDAYSHEVVSFGFWPGDDIVREPAFYSYTFPLPAVIENQQLQPASAKWVDSNGSPMAFLSYEALRQEEDPETALLNFLESAYQAGATLAGWPVEELTVPPLEAL